MNQSHFPIVNLDPRQAFDTLERFVVVDVRQPYELGLEPGAIHGAINVPLPELVTVGLPRNLDRNAELLLVCRSGRRSMEAGASLVAAGYGRVYNLHGGMLAWQRAGLPTLREAQRDGVSREAS